MGGGGRRNSRVMPSMYGASLYCLSIRQSNFIQNVFAHSEMDSLLFYLTSLIFVSIFYLVVWKLRKKAVYERYHEYNLILFFHYLSRKMKIWNKNKNVKVLLHLKKLLKEVLWKRSMHFFKDQFLFILYHKPCRIT